VTVKKIEGRGVLRFKPPPSNRFWISFETMPKVEMSIEPIVSSRQITYSIILRAIESRIMEVIAETIVLPHWDDVPFADTQNFLFRGGVWADNPDLHSPVKPPKPVDTAAEDGMVDTVQHEENDGVEDDHRPDHQKLSDIHERSHSMPVLQEAFSPFLTSRKSTSSSLTKDTKEEGLSSSVDSLASASIRLTRTPSHGTSASAVVGIDSGSVEAKGHRKGGDLPDATAAITAIARKSQPSSPAESPVGSPSKESSILERALDKRTQPSSRSSTDESTSNGKAATSAQAKPSQDPTTPPRSSSSSSHESALSHALSAALSHHKHQKTPEKTSTPLMNATTAAKRWSIGLLNRKPSERVDHNQKDQHKNQPGSPENPIGRGRPLPPLGQPLPFPPKSGRLSSLSSFPTKSQSTSSVLTRRESSSKSIPESDVSETKPESKQDEIFVVAAPPESTPPSPKSKKHLEAKDPQTQPIQIPDGSSSHISLAEEEEEDPHSSYSSERRRRLTSGDVHEDEEALESWHAAQEEENRFKNSWTDSEPGHS
jgi:hypothetical protein